MEVTIHQCWSRPKKSGFDHLIILPLKEVQSDVSRSEDERVLMCPETKLPIRAEKLLLKAGIAHSTPNSDSNKSHRSTNGVVSWWNFGPSLLSSTSTTGGRGSGSGVRGTRQILHLLTKPRLESSSSSSLLSDGGVYAKFEELVSYLGGDVGKVSRVYAIDHPSQRAFFEHYRTMITKKHADSEGLFKKDGWGQASDAGVRKR